MANIKFTGGAKLNSPCLNCNIRKIGCHGKCELYREYRKKYNSLNDKEFKEKMKTYGPTITNFTRHNKLYK